MKFKDREREWLNYFPRPKAFPTKGVCACIQRRIKMFRDEHPDFNDFLIELDNYLKEDKEPCIYRVHEYIEKNHGGAKYYTFYILNILIKLYNYYYSPSQTYEYIKECFKEYCNMLSVQYEVSRYIDYIIEKSSMNNRQTKYLSTYIYSKEWFNVNHHSTSSYNYKFNVKLVIIEDEDHITDFYGYCEYGIELSEPVFCKDVIDLFDRYNNNKLYKMLLNLALEYLKKRGINNFITGSFFILEPAIFKDEQK